MWASNDLQIEGFKKYIITDQVDRLEKTATFKYAVNRGWQKVGKEVSFKCFLKRNN